MSNKYEIFTNNLILCVMYKTILRGVLCANKCKIIHFPRNENNVDQLFPIAAEECYSGRVRRPFKPCEAYSFLAG